MSKKGKKRIKFLVITSIIVLIIMYIYPYFNEFRKNEDYTQVFDIYDNKTKEEIYDKVSSIKNNDGTILERLEKLKKQDGRINTIIDNYNDYPEDLLDMLSRNIEMLDFVINYPDKKGKTYSDTIGKIEEKTIPLLLQWDERWGYSIYGNDIMAINGCGPTALAMVIVGLTEDNSITPSKIAEYSIKNGYFVDGAGTSWSLMSDASTDFGVKSEELPLSKNSIIKELEKGHPIIASMRAGDFTTTGHFIVLTNLEDGKIKINDPNSKARSSLLWDYERIESQIRNLWAFSLK